MADLAEYRWLTSVEAEPWLSLAADGSVPLHRRAAQLRQELTAAQAHLVLEQAELRARAGDKFGCSERLLLSRVGLEQATDQWIAAYKSLRFPPGERVADLCCGIGGDLMGLVARTDIVGYDRDPVAAFLAEHNARCVVRSGGPPSRILCADVESADLGECAGWHIDPDRRARGRRTIDPTCMSPGQNVLERLLAQNEHAAIKLAPATVPPSPWQDRAELEWISRGRECRQLVAWFGRLARAPSLRRATILDAYGAVSASITGVPQPWPAAADEIGEFLYEPDPAVLAAGLAGQVAVSYGIPPVAPNIPYFTANERIHEAALAVFHVDAVLPFDAKKLAAALRARDIGRLEIKCRGVRLSPEALRSKLRLCGENEAVLLVTPHRDRTVAILAHRERG